MNVKKLTGKIKTNNAVLAGALISILLLFVVFGCSANQSQTPEDFVKLFITKYIPLLDTSAADFYVKDEQSGIKEFISHNIQLKQAGSTYDALKNATYDLSHIRVSVLDRKSMYIDDEPKTLVEVTAKGFYTVTTDDQKDTFLEDEIFVLQAIGDEWKITKKIKPWEKI